MLPCYLNALQYIKTFSLSVMYARPHTHMHAEPQLLMEAAETAKCWGHVIQHNRVDAAAAASTSLSQCKSGEASNFS